MAELVVETRCGKVRGEQRGEVGIWKGIPYGAAPVGDQRFRAPRPAEPWTGVRDAIKFGPVAIQSRDPRIAMLSGVGDRVVSSEDCLMLNIYAPVGMTGRPVMVWIHGGAFIMGSSSTPIYNGTSFAERGVVVVTINYRLGLTGLLYLGDLVPGREAGNPFLLDQVAALAWVRDNIAAFGGDPGQVTVMGESAGAISIGLLLAMPAARGLFHRAILESGSAPLAPVSRDDATKLARGIAEELGVAAAELPEVPIEKLLAAQEHYNQKNGVSAFAPYTDGVTVPERPLDVLRSGVSASVPLLIGTNRDEWSLFEVLLGEVTIEPFKPLLRARLGPAFDKLFEGYRDTKPDRSELRAWVDIVGDLVFRIPAIRTAEGWAAHGGAAYMYRFDWASPAFGGRLGATHALELPFVWNKLDLPASAILLGPDPSVLQPIANKMNDSWVAFISTGDPNGAGLPMWPRYDAEHRPTMLIDREAMVVVDPGGATRQLWPEL